MKSLKLQLIAITLLAFAQPALKGQVEVSVIQKNFPTYNLGSEQSMPFLKDFNIPGMRFFRGSRSVYPYTFINDYKPGKKDKEYDVVRLENEFIYVDIIPQLRGRIQGAVDKRNGWDFLYYNKVIKPAEISVRSAWISGGLEHNHPMGHGYTQFDKISYDIFEGSDGSLTIVIAEVEPIRMMKWEFEITLHPGQLYFETKGRLISTAPFPVPFLSSNNAAMHTTEEMEMIYPQESWAAGHGFRTVKKWPYYYSDDQDWTWLKNTQNHASLFADGTGLYYDYWGVYSHDNGIDAGSVMVADHRTAPGKKYFSWGMHELGRMWDFHLSDEDGGYVELQQQAYYSNLGYGYAMLDPFEVKEFSIFWYPIKSTGGFVSATRDAALNFLRIDNNNIKIILQPTSDLMDNTIKVYVNGAMVNDYKVDLPVGEIYSKNLSVSSLESDTLKVRLVGANGKEILSYANKLEEIKPEINKLPDIPDSELSIDQLYAKGLQDYHDPFSPEAEKAFNAILERDPLESRANRMFGITYIKRGQYEKAIKFLRNSLVNDHFESCYHTHLLMGYAFLQLGDMTNAHVHLVQSSRRKAHLEASLYYLAQVEILKGDLDEAKRYLEDIPVSRLTHPDIHILKSYVFRRAGETKLAKSYVGDAFEIDPLSFKGWTERLHLEGDKKDVVQKIHKLFDRKDSTFLGSQLYLETAAFYINLRDYEAALKILSLAEIHFSSSSYQYPFIDFYKGYSLMKLGRAEQALEYYSKASGKDFTYVFPYRTLTVDILKDVLKHRPNDAVALMYYGDLLYHLRRHDEGVAAWQKAHGIDPSNARLTRNLALGLYVQTRETEKTVSLLEEAFRLSGKNRRVYNELEQIYNLRKDYASLEKLYDENWDVIQRSGEFALTCADLYLRKGRYEDILTVFEATHFPAVETGIGQPRKHSRYQQACIGLGEQQMGQGNLDEAIGWLLKSYEYPEYLNEAKATKPVTVRLDYLLGTAYLENGMKKEAKASFQKAVSQEYNTVSEDAIFRAKALEQLGKKKEAKALISELQENLLEAEDEEAVNIYVNSLVHAYLGDQQKAKQLLSTAIENDKDVVYRARFESSYISLRRR